jgi:hypothetical protein
MIMYSEQDGAEREDGEARVVDAHPAVDVAEPAERHHQHGADEQVTHQHPEEITGVAWRERVELDPAEDGGQRDQDDGAVDGRHQRPERRVRQRDPLVAIVVLRRGRQAVGKRHTASGSAG